MTRIGLAAITLLLAGCAGEAQSEWVLGGSFTDERTQDDIDAVCAASGQTECQLMESYPEQFAFRYSSENACRDARQKIANVPHTRVNECVAT